MMNTMAAPAPPSSKGSSSLGTWTASDAYEPYIGRWSRAVARDFIQWLDLPAAHWLDVGCGTGAISEAIVQSSDDARVTAVDRSAGYLAYAERRLAGRNIAFLEGDALALPVPDQSVDAAVSGLVLNFLADPERAVGEMRRTVRRGGTVAAYVWDYAEGMQFLRAFWDAALPLDPEAVRHDEARRSPFCAPAPLADLFRMAGLADVTTRAITVPTHFAGFEDLWQPFLGGQGTIGSYVASLSEERREAVRERLQRSLPASADGTIRLFARAWAVRGKRS